MNTTPKDIIIKISKYLDQLSLIKSLRVCKQWHLYINSHYVKSITSENNIDQIAECIITDNILQLSKCIDIFKVIIIDSSDSVTICDIMITLAFFCNNHFVKTCLERIIGRTLHYDLLYWQVLTVCSKNGYLNLIKIFVDNTAKVTGMSKLNKTFFDSNLISAIEHNQLSIIKYMIKSGADFNIFTYFRYDFDLKINLLTYAKKLRHDDIANYFAELGLK